MVESENSVAEKIELYPGEETADVKHVQFARSQPQSTNAAGADLQAVGGYARYDLATIARQRDYQAEIERASALLCSVQPDLVAGEVVPVHSVTSTPSRWPVFLLVAATALFWTGVIWLIASLI